MATYPFSAMPAVMNRRADQVRTGHDRLMRDVGRAIHHTVVRTTRVDTGLARSNWVVTRDREFTSVIPPYSPGKGLGIAETANATAAIRQGNVAFQAFDSRRNRRIYITNNVHYIGILNDGGPNRAGDFMVQRGIQSGMLVVTRSFFGRP